MRPIATLTGIAAFTLFTTCVGFAKSRSVDSFRAYVQRRVANVEEATLEAFVKAVDADADGSISDEEFKNRIAIFQQVFPASKPKVAHKGNHLPENWLAKFEDAQSRSAKSKKPVLAMFSASWCGPCKSMIANVYPTRQAKEALASFVPVYVDSEKQRDLATENEIRAFPTFVCFDAEGNEVARKVGGGNVEEFVEMLAEFAKKVQ